MICPNCQTCCADSARFCSTCGTALLYAPEPPKPKKGTRWIPVLILFLISVAGLILFFATADSSAPIRVVSSPDSSWFSVKDGKLHFEESLYTGGSELEVPSEIAGVPITALSENCFYNCENLTAVILPDSLLSIGDGAFYGCTSLRGIYIPASVQTIGEEAFYGCTALEAICIHNSMNSIRRNAFDNCNRMSYIYFTGTHGEWTVLYSEFINPYVTVFCKDGSFYQDGNVYD